MREGKQPNPIDRSFESALDPSLQEIELQLRALRAQVAPLDRDRLFYLAGRASVESTSRAFWVWPASTVTMSAVAATLLAILLTRPADVTREAKITELATARPSVEPPPQVALDHGLLAARDLRRLESESELLARLDTSEQRNTSSTASPVSRTPSLSTRSVNEILSELNAAADPSLPFTPESGA